MADQNFNTLFEDNFKVAKRCATEGIVLLKNDGGFLPLDKGTKVAPIGADSFNLLKGGGGSADVYSPYVKTLIDGLLEQQEKCNIMICQKSLEVNHESNEYSDAELSEIGENSDVAIFSLRRYSGEAFDRKAEKGDYYLSDDESALLDKLQNCSEIENIVVILNLAGVSDCAWIEKYSKIKSVLLVWLPGMEGGSAVADILCGEVNPSGKLTDTFVYNYNDFPSAVDFAKSEIYVPYTDDIFVGYRYFETMAKDKVQYPFGFGLSYTTFEYENIAFSSDDENITVELDIKNTGKVSGKEIVQVYCRAPKGRLPKPFCELKAYKKTSEILPKKSEHVKINFPIKSLASFDDTGATEFCGAYVLESGVYEIYVAKNIREQYFAGSLGVENTYVAEQLSLKLTNSVPTRLNENGKLVANAIGEYEYSELVEYTEKPKTKMMLKDVADKKCSIEQFIAQLSDKQLIDLGQAQPPAFPRGTAGVGNIKEYGIVNAQTADGPLGLRKTTPTTCFPCPTLVACTWDEKLQYELGRAIGFEGISTKVDILLAPALNIHRNPLCGRNFEYYSEDPLISGKTAAAEVRGVQSQGMAATIKHFAANNKEENRYDSSSLISERALREIYLKGFEITVKQSNPWCVMTSYNLINGVHPSENRNLLQGVLRDEWGFDGAIMSDWRNHCHQYSEIMAGQNIKMPYGYPEELALTYDMLQNGTLSRAQLQENAKYVLELIMKTDRFLRQDFGFVHSIGDKTSIKAVEFTGSTTTWCSAKICKDTDGGYNVGGLGRDNKGTHAGLIYQIIPETAGEYKIDFRIATPDDRCYLEVLLDDEHLSDIHFSHKSEAEDKFQDWFTVSTNVNLPKNEHKLMVVVHIFDAEDREGISINRLDFTKK